MVVQADDAEGSPVQLNFVQAASALPTLTASADHYDVSVDGQSLVITIGFSGGEAVEWSAQVNGDFAHLVGTSSGTGDGTLTVSVDPNANEEQRSFELTITAGGASGSPKALHFVQDAADAPDPTVLTVATDSYIASADGQSLTITIEFSGGEAVEWSAEISSGTEFSRVVGVAAGDEPGTVVVEVDLNEEAKRRSFSLTVTAEDASRSPQTLHFSQDAGAGPPEPARIRITASSYEVDFPGGPLTVNVIASPDDVRWTASLEDADSEDAWARISGPSDGEGNGPLLISVDRNTTGERRSFELTVTIIGTEAETRTVTFVQTADALSKISAKTDRSDVPYAGGPVWVNVENIGGGALNWTAAITEPFATIEDGEFGTGSGVVRVLVSENEGEARAFTVIVSAEGSSNSPQEVSFRQEAKPERPRGVAKVFANKYSVSPSGETVTVNVDISGNDSLNWEVELTQQAAECVVLGGLYGRSSD